MIDIKASGISKKYLVYSKPSDRIREFISFDRKKYHYERWALKDINIEIEKGTTIGVVGPNGSGKSTLLKIISGITCPTEGTVETGGRISALIELGMGFHPEFSGRENVYMNAALLGISRHEINKRFDDILEFSELHEYIDFPIKTYSSGMQVRLAFAVAINTSPDILIIDEALAVGDTLFQHRCINKIKEFQKKGITIFFVSHDPGAVKTLCKQALLLDNGRLLEIGDTGSIMDRYNKLISERETSSADHENRDMQFVRKKTNDKTSKSLRHGSFQAKILSVQLYDYEEKQKSIFVSGDQMVIQVEFIAHEFIAELTIGIMIRNRYGFEIYGTNTHHHGKSPEKCNKGEKHVVSFTQKINMAPDDYFVTIALHSGGTHMAKCFDWWNNAISFKVLPVLPNFTGVVDLHSAVHCRKIKDESKNE